MVCFGKSSLKTVWKMAGSLKKKYMTGDRMNHPSSAIVVWNKQFKTRQDGRGQAGLATGTVVDLGIAGESRLHGAKIQSGSVCVWKGGAYLYRR